MEIWDAYDINFKKIEGKTLVRGENIPRGIFHLACDVLVTHSDGTYLLMQRDKRKSYGGMWEASAGGSALAGESAKECIIRELKEETGIISENITEVGISVNEEKKVIFVEFLCITDIDKKAVILQDGETIDYKWVTKEELLMLIKENQITDRMKKFLDIYK